MKWLLCLLKRQENLIYDPYHANNHAIGNGVIHAFYIWVGRHLPNKYMLCLQDIYTAHLSRCPYHQPLNESCGKKDWMPSNSLTKEILENDEFWCALKRLLPTTADNLTIKYKGQVLQDPLQRYLDLMRELCIQITSWAPRDVHLRDQKCKEAHELFHAIDLPKRRFGVTMHYFFEHYTPHLRYHKNLLSVSCEGGEHLHQPHTSIVARRPSRPRYKCPVGLREVMKKVRLGEALWRQGWSTPAIWNTKHSNATVKRKKALKVPLGQQLCHQYAWAKNSVISTPGPRTLSSVPLGPRTSSSVSLGQELCHQYPWAKISLISTPGFRTLSSVPLGQELCPQYPWATNSVISTPGPRLCHQYPWAKNSVISTPGPRSLSLVLLGQEPSPQYPRVKNSLISTPGSRTLSLISLGLELCPQYPWAKNSVFSTLGPSTLSSVAPGQELCHQYPWVKNSVISTPGPRTLSSVPLGQELCHQYH